MKTILDILQIAVIVVYIVMVVYTLWTNDRLLKAVDLLNRDNLTWRTSACRAQLELRNVSNKLHDLKRDRDELHGIYQRELREGNELRAKYDELLREKEELKSKYDLLHAESATLEYVNGRIKEIAEEECPSIASLYKRMMLIREQNIKDIMERAKQYDEEHCDGWGKAFEQAAQESSNEEREESVKKA